MEASSKNGATLQQRSQAFKPLVAKDYAADGKYHVLLAASGSVATIKLPNIIRGLASTNKLAIRIVLTQAAAQFLQGQSDEQPTIQELTTYPNVEAIYMDEHEWSIPWIRDAPILHIELRRWADLLIIAPLSANTLAKLSNGLCDNLLTSVVRAWEVQPRFLLPENSSAEDWANETNLPHQKPILVAPAMNTLMWQHPLTKLQLDRLVSPLAGQSHSWIKVLWPIEKELACGDTGAGAMTSWSNIVSDIFDLMASHTHSHGVKP